MTRSEYEARRRRLDEERRIALELLEAGHRTRVQMLELLWSTEGEPAVEPAAPDPEPIPAAPPPPDPEPRPRRRGVGELRDEVIDLLPHLGERFTKDDVDDALAEPAERSSLFKVLQELQADGWFRIERPGRGRHPTVYRQTQRKTAG